MCVVAPFPFYEIEVGETNYDGFFEACHVHAHEADAGEVIDGAFLVLILLNGNAELVPCGILLVAVAQSDACFAGIDDEVPAHYHVFRAEADVVFVKVLVLVHGVVGVHILSVRCALVGCRVSLSRPATVG